MRYICTSIVATLVLASTGIAWADDAVQWTEAEGGNGHWYEFQDGTGSNWNNHRQTALAAGGDLACPIDESTHTYLKYLMETMGDCVNLVYISIGGLQSQGQDEPDGGWQWVSGAEWGWTNWHPGEPNDSGGEWALVYTGANCGGLWNDINPTLVDELNRGYIIEWSADCNGDGIVDYGQILDGSLLDTDGNGVPDCCDAGGPCPVQPIQWRFEDGGNGHWYHYVIEDWTVDQHTANAETLGAHLVSLTSADEVLFVEALRDAIAPEMAFHTGGYQDTSSPDYSEPAGGWAWTTGEPWAYDNWGYSDGAQQPDNAGSGENRLGVRWQEDGIWCDIPAGLEWAGVLEWSADCNGDGIVDYGQILDGTFLDTDGNGVPDCCDVPGGCDDCNDNGVLDSEDVADGTSEDCNANGVPDECDTADGTSEDCNANGVPDECETLADCDGDGTSDACELLAGAIDANPADGIPDVCQGLVRGACCISGICVPLTADECFAIQGSYAGVGVWCDDANCPTLCLGDVNSDGVVAINDLLTLLSNWGPCP